MNFKIIRQSISSRGGGVEIDLTPFGYEGEKMAAYQNYLGGGMLGAIQVNDTMRRQSHRPFYDEDTNRHLDKIGKELMQYMHELTNPDDEWAGSTFEENQKRPVSGY